MDTKYEQINNSYSEVNSLISKLSRLEGALSHMSKDGQEWFEWKIFKIFQKEEDILIVRKKDPKKKVIKADLKEKEIKVYEKIGKETLEVLLELNNIVYPEK